MKEEYKRPLLIRLLNRFLFPKEHTYEELSSWYLKKNKTELPLPVQKYLKLMMKDIYQYNHFDSLGKVLLNGFLFQNLKNLAYVEKHGTKFNKRAIFIVGLPRTGSTFFHKYLGSEPQLKCLSFWELNEIGKYNFRFIRKLIGQFMLSFQNFLTPDIKAIHFVENNGPEECSKILLSTFITQIYPLMFKLPAYEKEIDRESFEYTYEFYFKALSLIRSDQDIFLLKAPMHIQALDQLRKNSQNAPLVFLHRDIKEVLSSAYSLAKTYGFLFTPQININDLNKRINHRLSRDLDKALKTIQNDSNTYHYQYSEITGNKEKLKEQLEKDLGLKLNFNFYDLGKNQKKKQSYKNHTYALIEKIPEEFMNYQSFVSELEDSADQL